MRRAVLLSVAALLAFPAAASAANQTVQAVDSSTPDWSPKKVAVKPGETVTWTFTGTTQAHNVAVRRARGHALDPHQRTVDQPSAGRVHVPVARRIPLSSA